MIELPDETKSRLRGYAFLMTAIFIISFLMCCRTHADDGHGDTVTVEQIDKAIIYILKKGLPKHKIYPHHKHRILKDNASRMKIAKAIHIAALEKNMDPFLLFATAFREGCFLSESLGKIGERSMFQMTARTAKDAKKLDARCDLKTIQGSAFCAATWLRRWKNKCGTWYGALSVYTTGKTCKPVNKRVAWLAKDRLGIAAKLRIIVK